MRSIYIDHKTAECKTVLLNRYACGSGLLADHSKDSSECKNTNQLEDNKLKPHRVMQWSEGFESRSITIFGQCQRERNSVVTKETEFKFISQV